MPNYRAYTLDWSGHIQSVKILDGCDDDDAAVELATDLVGRHRAELWDGARFIAKIEQRESVTGGAMHSQP